MKHFFALLLLVVAVCAKDERFCPIERRGNKCVSKPDQYKCGAFLMNLQGQNETLRWLGALPDILNKPNVRDNPQLRFAITGRGIHKKSFDLQPRFCNDIYANARCYAIMKKVSKIPLDSCASTVLNDSGSKTVGQVLCEKAALFAPGQHFQSFVKIGFFHSACGGDWTKTHFKEEQLVVEEELCCRFEEGTGVHFRCNGADYTKSCDPAAEAENEARKKFFYRN